MNFQESIKVIYRRKGLVFWLAVLGAVLAFDLVVLFPPKYRADSRILVIQKQVEGQDIYSVSKSAQYLTGILKESVYSDSFFEDVTNSSFGISRNHFSENVEDRRKEWQKSVDINIIRDLGVMEISAYHPDSEKASQLSLAVTNILKDTHYLYHGGDRNVELKILDYPSLKKRPVMLDLWLATIFGAFLGMLTGGFWTIRKQKKQNDQIREEINKTISSEVNKEIIGQ